VNDDRYTKDLQQAELAQKIETLNEIDRLQKISALQVKQKENPLKNVKIVALTMVKRRVLPYELSAAFTVYIFELFFALLSLAVIYAFSLIEESFLGRVFSFIFDLNSKYPSGAGLAIWGIAIAINIATFLAFWLWYYFKFKLNPLQTVQSTFVTYLLIACSIVPILNLFPWCMLWILYVNTLPLGTKKR
jgi:hypothetical protein